MRLTTPRLKEKEVQGKRLIESYVTDLQEEERALGPSAIVKGVCNSQNQKKGTSNEFMCTNFVLRRLKTE